MTLSPRPLAVTASLAVCMYSSCTLVKAEDVTISIQPAFHAIPIWAAKQYGWFEELGLNVNLKVYQSGAPQVDDGFENDAWDIGIAGSPPNVIGGSKGMKTIAINNDESATTELVGGPNVDVWPPTVISDGLFAVTPKSTGELLLRHCLRQNGINIVEGLTNISMVPQDEVIERLTLGTSDYGVLWAPNTYTYRQDNGRAEVFCSGKMVDFPIYGGVMVRDEWATENTETVKKVLAAYLRGVTFMQNALDVEEAIRLSKEYHIWSETGELSDLAIKEDLHMRPLFNLDQQLDHMSRNFANDYKSDADRHYLELEEFLLEEGVIDAKNEPQEYITDNYMVMVSEDPFLRAYSYLGAADFSTVTDASSTSGASTIGSATLAGMVLSVGSWFLL